MQNMMNEIFGSMGTYIPSFLGALAILVVGWLIVFVVSKIGEKGLRKVGLNDWVKRLSGAEEQGKDIDVAKGVGTGMFYLIMLFVLVAFFQALRVPLISEPINGLLNQVFEFIPQVAGGAVLLLIAWVVAKVLKTIVTKGLEAAKIDERFVSGEETGEKAAPVSKSIADAVYWLVFLLFLPAILGALSLQGLLGPVQEMFNKLLGFLPNVITAGVLFLIGWFVARIVRQIVTNLLAAVGTDNLGEKVGLSQVLGEQKLSGLVGLIVYVFILLPIAIAALNTPRDRLKQRTFYVATGQPLVTAGQVAEFVKETIPSADVKIDPGLSFADTLEIKFRGLLDVKPTREQLGYEFKYADIRDGIDQLIDQFSEYLISIGKTPAERA